MKRVVSNIQNLGFTIMNETVEGSKQKPAGIVLDQTLVNGESQGVSVRLINGKQRSAAVKLDRAGGGPWGGHRRWARKQVGRTVAVVRAGR